MNVPAKPLTAKPLIFAAAMAMGLSAPAFGQSDNFNPAWDSMNTVVGVPVPGSPAATAADPGISGAWSTNAPASNDGTLNSRALDRDKDASPSAGFDSQETVDGYPVAPSGEWVDRSGATHFNAK